MIVRGAFILAAILAAVTACTTDKERIADQNEAAKTALPVTRTDYGEVSIFDIRVGDCLGEDAVFGGEGDPDELRDETTVEVLDCDSTDAYGRVTLLHLIDEGDDAPYPGDESMIALAEELCAKPAQPYTFFVPIRESWVIGDRTVTCIESIGFNYAAGVCIADADDVHRVIPCDDEAVFGDVLETIDLTAQYGPAEVFPGQDAIDAAVGERCPAAFDYSLSPTEFSWSKGDRLLVCVVTR